MFENIYTFVLDKVAFINEKYGINPWVFIILSIFLTYPYYYSLYRLIRSAAARDKKQFRFWLTIFLILSVVPYIYILFWGHNLPWYIYIIIAVLLLFGLYSLIQKIRKKRSAVKSRKYPDKS
ncbi:MAG: hypothetical protein ISR78_06815 [Spirochaetia bacterium]|nr:hypothetical protein [Spirochaetia bacterium]